MFERFKGWYKKAFADSDDIKCENIDKRIIESNNVETRMSFQYPSQENLTLSNPTQKRERKNRYPRQIAPHVDKKKREVFEGFSQQESRKTTSIKKTFQPSDVPSPIYGFQNRNVDRNISNTPAYIRRREQDPISNNFSFSGPNTLPELNEVSNTEPSSTNEGDSVKKSENVIPFNANLRKDTFRSRIENDINKWSESIKTDLHKLHEQKLEEKKEIQEKSTSPVNVEVTPDQKLQKIETGKTTIPPIHLLDDIPKVHDTNEHWIEEQMRRLETTLKQFNVKARVSKAVKGPAVTRFEVQPDIGVKVSKITNLADDIKLNLAAKDIRMEAPIPGKNAIGIEVPNQSQRTVSMMELIKNETFEEHNSKLAVGLGLDIEGTPIIMDLKKMPHGLIAGATGSGKSVCINTILISLLYKASPDDVKFLLVDPKMVELVPYNHLPHLVAPVITDVKAATAALKWAVAEMDNRYETFANEGVRDIERYNQKVNSKAISGEKMPYIVIVIDELADLMLVSPQDVEDAICRIAQKARACGIHLLLATQRPSVDVITGLIKANVPTRIAFSVSSQVDSRTIIDTNGADKLLGKGDMLYLENGVGKAKRIQGAFVSDDEIERVTSFVKKQASPNYLFSQDDLIQNIDFDDDEDELLHDAIDLVVEEGKASTSLLQRRFSIGYNRAARLIDKMEDKGLISEQNGSKPRDILVDKDQINGLKE